VLKRQGYIADFYAEKLENGRQVLKIQLKIIGKERAIVGIKRISRPGLRRYVGSQDVPRVLGGMGISILTTSRGIMTGHEAKKANVGGNFWRTFGDLLCHVSVNNLLRFRPRPRSK